MLNKHWTSSSGFFSADWTSAAGVWRAPAGHRQDPPLHQPRSDQAARTSLPQVWHPALFSGLGGPKLCPDHQPGGRSRDESHGDHGRRRVVSAGPLQRHRQILHQGDPRAEEGLQDRDCEWNPRRGQNSQRLHCGFKWDQRRSSESYWIIKTSLLMTEVRSAAPSSGWRTELLYCRCKLSLNFSSDIYKSFVPK